MFGCQNSIPNFAAGLIWKAAAVLKTVFSTIFSVYQCNKAKYGITIFYF